MARKPKASPPHLRIVSDSTKKRAPSKTGGTGGGKGGRPPHVPTPQTRSLICALKGTGFTDAAVANAMEMSLNTLKTHYLTELAQGRERAHAKIAATLFQIATDKNHPRCVTAAIFLAKAQLGWRDVPVEDDDTEGDMVFSIGIGEKRGA